MQDCEYNVSSKIRTIHFSKFREIKIGLTISNFRLFCLLLQVVLFDNLYYVRTYALTEYQNSELINMGHLIIGI
jgi:hypothetical protein